MDVGASAAWGKGSISEAEFEVGDIGVGGGHGGAIRVRVALVPADARRWHDTICVLVDELRASSTIVTLLDRGARTVIPAGSVAEARRLARDHGRRTNGHRRRRSNGHGALPADGALLAGEQFAVRPPGFDFGNSPTELARADLRGRTVVFTTRNGTAVLRSLPADATMLVGCLLNAAACARAALEHARHSGRAIGVVCAGRDGAFALDDALAAGRIVECILGAAGPGERVELNEAAHAAHQLWRGHPDVLAAFRITASGRVLAHVDMGADVAFCAQLDTSDAVPVVVRAATPLIERLAI